jgi:hypothetical protein
MSDARPLLYSSGHIAVTLTDATAVPFADQPCVQLTVVNDTGESLSAFQGSGSVGITIPDGTPFTFFGISNASQIKLKAKDGTGTYTVSARWEG